MRNASDETESVNIIFYFIITTEKAKPNYFLFSIPFFEMCRRFSYVNYTWKNTFGKRGGGVLVVSNRIPFSIPFLFYHVVDLIKKRKLRSAIPCFKLNIPSILRIV